MKGTRVELKGVSAQKEVEEATPVLNVAKGSIRLRKLVSDILLSTWDNLSSSILIYNMFLHLTAFYSLI